MDQTERGDLLKLYELIQNAEDRYLNRTETRSRFYQVIVSALIGAGTVALVQLVGNTAKYSPSELLLAGFAVQAVGVLGSFVAIWALPGIFRVYRRSVWEAAKRYRLEMLLGLSPGVSDTPPWPLGLENVGETNRYLVERKNLGNGHDRQDLLKSKPDSSDRIYIVETEIKEVLQHVICLAKADNIVSA